MLSRMWTELRTAVRSLLRSRGFALAAVLTLGLGVALSAAVLLVLNAYLFRTLPYPAAERLYGVQFAPPGQPGPEKMETIDWRALDDIVEHGIAWDLDVFYLVGGDRAESARGAWVTPGFMNGLGIQPVLGRAFDAAAFAPGAPNVAIISDRLWRSRYNGDPGVLGRQFDAYVSDRPQEAERFTIVGVMPPDFWHLNPYTDVMAPLRAPTYPYMVRLREGVTPQAAGDRISALVRGSVPVPGENWRATLVSTHDSYVERLRPVLRSVAIAAALVLLVALANVAGLLLVRVTQRQREIAVRRALGAGRLAIARLLLVEGMLLGLGATVVGVFAGVLLMQWIAPLVQRELGRQAPGGLHAFALDPKILLAALACGVGIGLACTVTPLIASWRMGLAGTLQSGGGRGGTEGRGSQRLRSLLIALEVAASLTLVAGSTLMLRSVANLLDIDFGIEAANVATMPIALRQRTYPDLADRVGLFERALPRLQAIPGVDAVAMTDWWPLQQARPRAIAAELGGSRVEGRSAIMSVTPSYFETLRIPLVSGRAFTAQDRIGAAPVALVSETLARSMWSGAPLGGRVTIVQEGTNGARTSTTHEIVGVVRDVRQAADDEDFADVYVPFMQSAGRAAWLYARSGAPAAALTPAIQRALREIDPEIPGETVAPMQASIDQQLARPKFLAWLLAGFSIVAGALSLVGVYGVIAYAVRQREREIAVRVAVGADPRRITSLFLKQGAVIMAAGVMLGLAGAVAAGRALESQLFGVGAADPLTLVIAAVAFTTAGGLAIWWPARRAAATAPSRLLR